MKVRHIAVPFMVAVSSVIASLTIGAQDKSMVKVPDGLGFSDFKGYENWQTIAPSETEDGIKSILGNPVMMKAYADGFPVNGKTVPDGAMMTKIDWVPKVNTESPYFVKIPDTLSSVSFMLKDSKKFSNTGGWAWAQFKYDAASR